MRFKGIQLGRRFLVDEPDAGKAVGAFFCLLENTAVRPHLVQQVIFHEGEDVFLDPLQIPLAVQVVDLWEDLRNIRVVLVDGIAVADAAAVVGRKGESERAVLVGGKLPAEIILPAFHVPVRADSGKSVEQSQIFGSDRQGDGDLYILTLFVKISGGDGIIAADGTERVQDGGLAYAVFSYQDQGAFNIFNFQVADQFEIFDTKILDLHRDTSLFNLRKSGSA